jgi:hypothetical protein
MRGGKEHARQAQSIVPDETPRASGSSRDNATQPDVSGESSNTQSTPTFDESGSTAAATSDTTSRIYQEVLFDCNKLVEQYRKGEISKAAVYVEIQSKLAKTLEGDRARSDAAFGSFIATIESHDSETSAATARGRVAEPAQRPSSPASSVSDGYQAGEEPVTKKLKIDESAYAWVANRQNKRTVLRETLSKTLKLIEVYSTLYR